MKHLMMLAPLLLAGCGSFPLGTVHPEQSQTVRQRDQDLLFCKDLAHDEIDTTARRIGGFFAGLTLVGYPAAVAERRDAERKAFAVCMQARGYRVEAPA